MMIHTIEALMLTGLLNRDEYARKVLPFLNEEYFTNATEQIIFKQVKKYIEKYSNLPTKEALIIQLSEETLTEDMFTKTQEYISEMLNLVKLPEDKFLLEKTENFCKEKALYLALRESINIVEDSSQSKDRGIVPKLLTDALAVSFDPHVGHNYMEDYQKRYDSIHNKVEKVPFDIDILNKITKGGVERKSLNIILAPTNAGKSLVLCHFAANAFLEGKNVLYITLEMAEEKIAQRIDANLLNLKLDDLESLSLPVYQKKLESLKSKTTGQLVVKEYPTSSANVMHFRALLRELQLKKQFVPDIIFVDYLNIMSSSRHKRSTDMYSYVKSIAEELRGLAVEENFPIWTATQTNRGGAGNSDVTIDQTSESWGVPNTADFMAAIIRTEDLDKLNQVIFIQLKSRYGDVGYFRKFVVGMDRARMKLYNVEQSAQDGIVENKEDENVPAFDKTRFGNGMTAEKGFGKFKFEDDDG